MRVFPDPPHGLQGGPHAVSHVQRHNRHRTQVNDQRPPVSWRERGYHHVPRCYRNHLPIYFAGSRAISFARTNLYPLRGEVEDMDVNHVLFNYVLLTASSLAGAMPEVEGADHMDNDACQEHDAQNPKQTFIRQDRGTEDP